MVRIIGIAGSLRKQSLNAALLRAASELMPSGSELVIGTIAGIPLYDGDLEASSGTPPAVQTLKDQIAGADGLFLISPEYNHSLPGVLKNAIDWMSRPPADAARVFKGKKLALAGVTPGPGATRFAQTAWLPVFRALGLNLWFGASLYVGEAQPLFDADGKLIDEAMRTRLRKFLEGFSAFVQSA